MRYNDLFESDNVIPDVILKKKTHDLLTSHGYEKNPDFHYYLKIGDDTLNDDHLKALGWKPSSYSYGRYENGVHAMERTHSSGNDDEAPNHTVDIIYNK